MSWPEIALAIAAQIFAAGAIYGAIRADLRALHERVGSVEKSADGAHQRIDTILLRQ